MAPCSLHQGQMPRMKIAHGRYQADAQSALAVFAQDFTQLGNLLQSTHQGRLQTGVSCSEAMFGGREATRFDIFMETAEGTRSEERRVGKERRARWLQDH